MAPPAETTFADLGVDVLDEIFVRLPSQASLAVAAAVSRTWYRVCTTPAFLRRFRRRCRPGSPLLCLLHSPGRVADLRVLRAADAGPHRDLAATRANIDDAVRVIKRFRCYHDLHILDHRNGRLLLKPRMYNHLFVYDLLLDSRHAELKWPHWEVFPYMTGFLLDRGDAVFVQKPYSKDDHHQRRRSDHCYVYSSDAQAWRRVEPRCRDADAHRYAECRYNIVRSERAGEVVYTLCWRAGPEYDGAPRNNSRCLVALDTRTMERSLVELPRYLGHRRWWKKARNFTVMEMDDGGIGLVAADEPAFVLRVWLREGGGDGEWTMYRKVVLTGLVREVADRFDVKLTAMQVVAAFAGVVHLRLVAAAEEQGTFCFFASLELRSMEFSNVQSATVSPDDKFYPCTLPWRPPFLPPAEEEETNNLQASY